MTTLYRSVDFRPVAVPGWRVVFRDGSGWTSRPLAGWIVQEEVEMDHLGNETPTGYRYATAAIMLDEADPEVAERCQGFWKVLGPGEPDPTPEDEARGPGLTLDSVLADLGYDNGGPEGTSGPANTDIDSMDLRGSWASSDARHISAVLAVELRALRRQIAFSLAEFRASIIDLYDRYETSQEDR